MNYDLNWDKWGLWFFKFWSELYGDLLDKSAINQEDMVHLMKLNSHKSLRDLKVRSRNLHWLGWWAGNSWRCNMIGGLGMGDDYYSELLYIPVRTATYGLNRLSR